MMAGAVAPVVLSDGEAAGRDGVGYGGRLVFNGVSPFRLISFALAAETAVRIAGRRLGLVVTSARR